MNNKTKKILASCQESLKKNFRFATLDFIFIITFVTVFQKVFGMENSIVGVIFTIMMASSMLKDMTASPVKHLAGQAAVLAAMAVSACVVNTLPPVFSFPLNFGMIFLILYVFTYETFQPPLLPIHTVLSVPDLYFTDYTGSAAKASGRHDHGCCLHHSVSVHYGP